MPPSPANANVSGHVTEATREEMRRTIAEHYAGILRALGIDTANDHNSHDTPRRVAKMLVDEACWGRFNECPKITDFPNAAHLDEIYTVGPISVRSLCSHHMLPIFGRAWIGVIPSERVIGLSKFNRIVQWVMQRPQIQEEATIMLADKIEELIKPKALGVVVKATHTCMTWRGVKDNDTDMVTSVMRGTFRDNPAARNEFLTFIKGQKFQ
jgi:GTP cyclohydrolase I